MYLRDTGSQMLLIDAATNEVIYEMAYSDWELVCLVRMIVRPEERK
jgi:hypothetical protein